MRAKSLLSYWLRGASLLVAFQNVSADCQDESICVDTINQGDDIELHARNLPGQTEQIMVLRDGGKRSEARYRYSLDWTIGDKDAVHDDDHLYSLPYASGESYRVIQGFGSRFSHTGLEEFAIDLDMAVGTPVHAARAGIVARVEESNSRGCWENGCGKYANYVVILHGDGTTGEYYHLEKDGAVVEVGDTVEQGQQIAYSGNTGHTTKPHLHFAVYRATDGGNTQSIPVRFKGAGGIIEHMRRGARHQAL